MTAPKTLAPISPSAMTVFEVIAELEEADQDIIAYFEPFIKDITRQKIAGWKRSGKVPMEAVDAVLTQSIDKNPEPNRVGITNEEIRDAEVPGNALPASSEFATGAHEGIISGHGVGKESGAGMTLVPSRPSGVAPRKSIHGPVVRPARTTDAPRHSGLQSSQRTDPEIKDEVPIEDIIDARIQPAMERLEARLLAALGRGAGEVDPSAKPTANGIRSNPRFRRKHWNEAVPAR